MKTQLREAKNEIGLRLRQFRKTCAGCHTQKDFAAVLNIDQQRLSGYENGTRVPHHVLAAFIRMGANPYWILFGEGPMRGSSAIGDGARKLALQAVDVADGGLNESQLAEFYILPLYADENAAAQPRDGRRAEVERPAIIHRVWCPHPGETDYVRVNCSGASMEPTIPAGAAVTIDRTECDAERLVNKIVAIATREGTVALKRLQRDGRGGFVGVPDNPAAGHAVLPLRDGDRVVGQVMTVLARLA